MAVKFLDVRSTHGTIRREIDAAIHRVIESGNFILSDEVKAFEREYAEFTGARECVTVGNGLQAIELTLRALGIGHGHEVLVPAHTFIATWLAVTAVGATLVPVDAAPGSFLMDLKSARKAITGRTRAILPVHLYGEPSPMDEIEEVARDKGLHVVGDAAQAHGAKWRRNRLGMYGDAQTYSFYPAKNLGSLGDGGAVVTNNRALARRLRFLRNYGGERKYDHRLKGTNSRLDALQAAVLRAKLRHLETWNNHRRRIAAMYDAAIGSSSSMERPPATQGTHVWHLYVVRTRRRESLRSYLHAKGIETGIHYPRPPHLTPAYAELRKKHRLPNSERLARQVMSLPMGPHMDDLMVEEVVRGLHNWAA